MTQAMTPERREYLRAARKKYRERHPDRVRAQQNSWARRTRQGTRRYHRYRDAVISILSPSMSCQDCGRVIGLEVHHIHHDGAADRERIGDTSNKYWRYYASHPDEARARLRVLCHSCHASITRRYTRRHRAAIQMHGLEEYAQT